MASQNSQGRKMLERRRVLHDAYEQAEFQSWLPIEINQISAGYYSGSIQMLENAEVAVCHESQNRAVYKRCLMDQQLCTVSFFRSTQSPNRFSEYSPADSSLFFLPAASELDIYVNADVQTVYFRFNQSELLHKATARDPSRWELPPDHPLSLDLASLQSLDKLVEQIFHHAKPSNQCESNGNDDALSDIITEHILLALSSCRPACNEKDNALIARRRAKHTVNCVIDYTKAQLAQHVCPSISAICADLKLSERTLQYGFSAILRISPYTYLRYMRLNGVRMALMQPATDALTVTRVAHHWHFLHLGRFSHDYQQMFGELPSATLRRALQT
ncbi:helix-turn-helix domain-containing protein [Alcaligenaceae bacterium]|nr:helix-turn-helix domain-containing protein [Alcaligenaceae bacterium]